MIISQQSVAAIDDGAQRSNRQLLLHYQSSLMSKLSAPQHPEQQPLLNTPAQPPSYDSTEDPGDAFLTEAVTIGITPDGVAEQGEVLQRKKASVWVVMLKVVLVALAVAVLVAFIKGFIDAGDVDVSLTCTKSTRK